MKKKTKKAKKLSPEPSEIETLVEFKGFLSFFILHELSKKPLAGEDLAKKIGRRKGTVLTPGTIYPALKNLKSMKLVLFEKQGRRKVYSLTTKGKKELETSYSLFSKYFYGLKNKIRRPLKKKILK